jgi:hypothetical protein
MNRLLVLGVLLTAPAFAAESPLRYPLVDTGQAACFDNRGEITAPKPGQPFFGQDAQFRGRQPSYTLSTDGSTVADSVTGLTWQRSPDTDSDGALTRKDKLTLAQAEALPAKLNAARFGGFSDWRLPTIKELYSLIMFSGVDPSGPAMNGARLQPFLDTKYFTFAYGDPGAGERLIDSQYASCTRYVGTSFKGSAKLFGVNFADGRITGYDLIMPGGGMEKTFFVQCVRGNPAYGRNDFRDDGGGTVTDRATGLTWSKADSGKGMNWEEALAWVQARNAEKYLGHADWRLPNAKELQSIVDYGRSPDMTGSAAIDPVFDCTKITNEIGQADYPFYWTGTTHAAAVAGGAAVYVAFGRAAGWPTGMPGRGNGPGRGGVGRGGPPETGRSGSGAAIPQFTDVHGAGSQRSDPKTGDPAEFPRGRGPQGDVVRIYSYVRLVRDAGGVLKPGFVPRALITAGVGRLHLQ